MKTITEEIEAKDFSDLRGSYTYYLCILGFDLLAKLFQVVIWYDWKKCTLNEWWYFYAKNWGTLPSPIPLLMNLVVHSLWTSPQLFLVILWHLHATKLDLDIRSWHTHYIESDDYFSKTHKTRSLKINGFDQSRVGDQRY